MNARVLIIDDEDLFREDLAGLLRRRGIECKTASNGGGGVSLVSEWMPDIVLCDIKIPDMDGIETLNAILQVAPDTNVIMMTAFGDLDTAITAFRRGAYDYLLKPIVMEDILAKVQRLSAHKQLVEEVHALRRQLSGSPELRLLVGQSEPIQRVVKLISDVASTRSTVLLTGESGTGKEVIARAIHDRSPNSEAPFIAINCAGIPESLLESELFGHVRGAFTGAQKDHTGYFECAGEGTLLLDEIGDMPLTLQSKLLRVLEGRQFVPVGGTVSRSFQARVIASTNQDLRRAVTEGRFREDLYFRIAVFEIPLPPLRQRRADIPLLAEHFVHLFNRELRRNCPGLNREAMRCFMLYNWPGNIREMRNVIERALIINRGDYIDTCDLPDEIAGQCETQHTPEDLRSAVQAFERAYIERTIGECGGNKEEAARRLNVNPSTLYRKLAGSSASSGLVHAAVAHPE